jgi:DNA modification methylase
MAWEQEQIGDCALYRGDAREILTEDLSFDVLLTDPPYGVNLHGKRGHYRHEPNAQRALHYQGFDDTPEYFQTVVLPIIQQGIAQSKRAAVFMASRSLPLLPPWDDLGGFFLPNGCGIGRWGFQCFMHIALYGTDAYAGQGARPNGRYGLYGNDANQTRHPCAKPLAALQWAVNRVSLPGEIVCDPFLGSGTTALACILAGRPCLGIELCQSYWDEACQRIEAAYRQLALFPPPTKPPQPIQESLYA